MFFIQPAYAQAAAQQQQGGGITQFIMLAAMFVGGWLILIRPQQKRAKEHKAMLDTLKRGDEVLTNGGLMGRLVAINEQAVDLEIAKGTVVRMQRQFIAQTLPKGSLKGELVSKAANDDTEKSK